MTAPRKRPKKKRRWLVDLGLALGLGALLVFGGYGIESLAPSPDVGDGSQSGVSEQKSEEGAEGAKALSERLDEELPKELQDAIDSAALDELDGTAQKTLQSVLGEAAQVETIQVAGEVPEAATQVLEDYQQAGAQLAYASYLDGLGRAWGCVAQGDGWVETCVVQTGEDEAKSRVDVVRFDRETWAETAS